VIGGSIVASHEDGLDKLGRHARGVLVLLAAVQVAGPAFVWRAGASAPRADVVGGAMIGAAFAGLAMWARTRPLPAVLCGLALYLARVGVVALVDPRTLYQGWGLKLIVAVMFINGVQTALTHERLRREHAPRAAHRREG
jgi:hypothetical protein